MNNIVRAWKDETYRQSLSAEEQAVLPSNPVGEIELTQAELEAISGAFGDESPFNFDNDRVDSQTDQNITIQPVLGTGSGTTSVVRFSVTISSLRSVREQLISTKPGRGDQERESVCEDPALSWLRQKSVCVRLLKGQYRSNTEKLSSDISLSICDKESKGRLAALCRLVGACQRQMTFALLF